MDVIMLIEKYIEEYQNKKIEIDKKIIKNVTDKDLLAKYNDSKDEAVKVFYKYDNEFKKIIDFNREEIRKKVNTEINNKRKAAIRRMSKTGTSSPAITLTAERIDKYETDEKFNYLLKLINSRIDFDNKPYIELQEQYTNTISYLFKVLKLLKGDYAKIELTKIDEYLQLSGLSYNLINILSREIVDFIKEKEIEYNNQKRIMEEKSKLREEELKRLKKEEEERLKKLQEVKPERKKELKDLVKNFDKIEDLFLEYSMIIPDGLETIKLEEIFNEQDTREISNLNFQEIDPELFQMVTITILSKLNDSDDINLLNNYVNYFNIICKKYQINSQLDELDKTIQSIYVNFICSEEDSEKLAYYQNEIFTIKNYGLYSEELEKEIDKIKNEIYKIRSNNFIKVYDGIKIPIKSFVLFDYEYVNGEMKPYITSDLDENGSRTMIDSSVDKSKIVSNGYNDFNELIDDLLLFGNPKVLLNQTDKLYKYIRPVYYIYNSYDYINTSMENSTGMYRIRPHLISNVRFIDEKIKLIPNTEKFNQIKELLESKLSNINISNQEPFDLYINYLTSFKLKDLESYKLSRNRQESSQIRTILKNKNDSFSPEELSFISQIIDLSLNAYKDLKNINDNFDFRVINKLLNSQTLS